MENTNMQDSTVTTPIDINEQSNQIEQSVTMIDVTGCTVDETNAIIAKAQDKDPQDIVYQIHTPATVQEDVIAVLKDRSDLLSTYVNNPDPKMTILPPVEMPPSPMALNAIAQMLERDEDSQVGVVDTTKENLDLESSALTQNVIHQKSKKPRNHAGHDKLVEKDITPLLDRFNGNKPKNKPKGNQPQPKQQSILLIPANRQATSYLERAFAGSKNRSQDEDGVDHINISSVAKTSLGGFLDINAHTPFEHRELSHFASVGGLWYYVKGEVPDERFRYIWGDRCREMGKRIKMRDIEGFKTIIADATWMKVIKSERATAELIESTLPFKNYYYFGSLNLKKSTPEAIWYTAAIEEIRRVLKLRKSTGDNTILPDFSSIEEYPQ